MFRATILTAGILFSSWSGVTMAASFDATGYILNQPSANYSAPERNQTELVNGGSVCLSTGCKSTLEQNTGSDYRQFRPERLMTIFGQTRSIARFARNRGW